MKLFLTLTISVLMAAALIAADKSVVGSWQCVSDSPDGEQYRWTVTVREQDGKLSGTISGAPGEFAMVDPRFENGTFTFRIQIEGQNYTVEAKISGDKLDGVWKGAASRGVIKGTRQS